MRLHTCPKMHSTLCIPTQSRRIIQSAYVRRSSTFLNFHISKCSVASQKGRQPLLLRVLMERPPRPVCLRAFSGTRELHPPPSSVPSSPTSRVTIFLGNRTCS